MEKIEESRVYKMIDKICRPIFEKAIIEKQQKENKSLKEWEDV